VVAAAGTTNEVADSKALPDLLDQIEGRVGHLSADGACDKRPCYQAIERIRAQAVMPASGSMDDVLENV
jgi:hypothetical protein